jgi:hypothetical protein
MPRLDGMEFCEVCQTEMVDCRHLRRQAHLKQCRDAAWNKVMRPKPGSAVREYTDIDTPNKPCSPLPPKPKE